MLRKLFCVLCFAPSLTLSAGEVVAHYAAEGKTDLDFGGVDFTNALAKTGDLGGTLRDATLHANATAEASASYRAKGMGYSLGIDADWNAAGEIEIRPNWFSGSSSSIETTATYRDSYRLVGEGTVPFGSTNLNFKFEGEFRSATNDALDNYWHAGAEVELVDRDTDYRYLLAEYSRGGSGNSVGASQVSGELSLSKILGPGQKTRINAGLRMRGQSSNASVKFRWDKTLKLDSITFPDGSTPEEHGFAIVFESGVTSPNLRLDLSAADFDLDGGVDGNDFLRWQRGLGIDSDALRIDGDADDNEMVDGTDLIAWQSEFGSSAFSTVVAANVPEPSSLVLMVSWGLAALLARRRAPTEED
jgi:hypothetical protein